MNGQTQELSKSTTRKVEIFSQLTRHTLAILYLIAELVIGFKPDKL